MRRTSYIVQAADGKFLAFDGSWTAEYPDAKLFPNLQAARRAVDKLIVPQAVGIYDTGDYAMGGGPVVCA